MSFLDRLSADMDAAFSSSDGPAEDVVLKTAEGAVLGTLRGFFDWPTDDAQPGQARIVAPVRSPQLTVLETALAALHVTLARGYRFSCRGTDFRVEVVRPDGIGGLVCKLKEERSAG